MGEDCRHGVVVFKMFPSCFARGDGIDTAYAYAQTNLTFECEAQPW